MTWKQEQQLNRDKGIINSTAILSNTELNEEAKRCVSKAFREITSLLEQDTLVKQIKYINESIMIWSCSSADGPGELHAIEENMNGGMYQDISREFNLIC